MRDQGRVHLSRDETRYLGGTGIPGYVALEGRAGESQVFQGQGNAVGCVLANQNDIVPGVRIHQVHRRSIGPRIYYVPPPHHAVPFFWRDTERIHSENQPTPSSVLNDAIPEGHINLSKSCLSPGLRQVFVPRHVPGVAVAEDGIHRLRRAVAVINEAENRCGIKVASTSREMKRATWAAPGSQAMWLSRAGPASPRFFRDRGMRLDACSQIRTISFPASAFTKSTAGPSDRGSTMSRLPVMRCPSFGGILKGFILKINPRHDPA